jgi:hypothetical protein
MKYKLYEFVKDEKQLLTLTNSLIYIPIYIQQMMMLMNILYTDRIYK